jgi:hypothetical protein
MQQSSPKTEDAPFYQKDDPKLKGCFIGPKALRNRDKQYKEGPIEYIDGHMSNDPLDLKVMDEFSRRAMKNPRLAESVDSEGRVFGNGVRSNWYGIRHVNGFPMQPATWPLAHNEHLRAESGLANDFTQEWHRRAFRALIKLFFTGLEPTAVKLRNGSSSCAPFFTTKMAEKIDILSYSLESMEKAGKLMLAGEHGTAWKLYHIGGFYYIVYRRQSSDKIDLTNGVWIAKDRPVADFEFAISSGRRGSYSPSSKRLPDYLNAPEGFFRERNRTAQGAPLGTNGPLMVIAHPIRKRIYDRYAFTFHHTTREEQQKSLREAKFLIAADVASHDQFWPSFILEETVSVMKDIGLPEWWVEIYRSKSKLPMYVTDVSPTEGNVMIGDLNNPNLSVGLPSGNAFTDLEGTMLMTWVYFIIMVEHTLPGLISSMSTDEATLQIMDQFLQGKLSIRLKDKSDDALLYWADEALVPLAQKLQQKMQDGEQVSPYMTVGYEHGGAFLGNILLYPADKDPAKMVLIGNILSFITNQLSPEYGVQSGVKDRSRVQRPFPGLAWESIHDVYGSSPVFGDVLELLEACWYDVFGESYIHFRDNLLERDRKRLAHFVRTMRLKSGLDSLTEMDHEVLASPDKLHYKFAESDISADVVDMLFHGLPLEKVEPHFNNIMRNVSL